MWKTGESRFKTKLTDPEMRLLPRLFVMEDRPPARRAQALHDGPGRPSHERRSGVKRCPEHELGRKGRHGLSGEGNITSHYRGKLTGPRPVASLKQRSVTRRPT